MRSKDLIDKASPCDLDFTDSKIQTVQDAIRRGRVMCPNFSTCQKRNVVERIMCYRQIARQMAGFIIARRSEFETAVEEERQDLLNDNLDGKFWVFRNDQWEIVEGIRNVIDDIVAFALTIIDFKPGDRRPFTQDGMKRPEFGVDDAIHNALLDLDDVYGEVGQRNPFR
jgi:hypothetical protein